MSKNLTAVFHRRSERERLAAGTGAEIQHLFSRSGASKQRRDLRAFVLHLEPALQESRFGGDRRVATLRAQRNAQAGRRPARWLRLEMRERFVHFLTRRT